MSDNHIDVAYIANLAKIQLSPEQTTRFSRDLEQILRYVDQLEQWDTEGVEPMSHPLPKKDALGEDCIAPSLPNEVAMANAPQSEEGQILVPKVVESAH